MASAAPAAKKPKLAGNGAAPAPADAHPPRAPPPTIDATGWKGADVLRVSQLSPACIADLFAVADTCKALVASKGGTDCARGRVLANAFFEPSTRTSCSFYAAMLRLGGTVVPLAKATSSAKKGETLADSARTLCCYADVLVLRHPRVGSCFEAADAVTKPVLNAGDGPGEHPTQALLDLYTIMDELRACGLGDPEAWRARGVTVTMVGDLKYGRTVHSLARLLARYAGVSLHFVSPASLALPAYVHADVVAAGNTPTHHTTGDAGGEGIDAALLAQTDVLYVTRVQKERFPTPEAYEAVRGAFRFAPADLAAMKPGARMLHPLPRVGEIDPACDADPRAAYWRQVENGMYVRMALLAKVMGVEPK